MQNSHRVVVVADIEEGQQPERNQPKFGEEALCLDDDFLADTEEGDGKTVRQPKERHDCRPGRRHKQHLLFAFLSHSSATAGNLRNQTGTSKIQSYSHHC